MTTETIDDVMTLEAIEPTAKAPAVRQEYAVTAPADLLRMAVEQGADLDRLERLMALQERWEAGEAKKKFAVAFAAFKAEAVKIIKGKLITDGPLKNKKHAELSDAVNAATPALSRHGLSTAWRLTKDDKDWMEITCTLSHEGGHSESVSMGGPPDTGPGRNAMQARGSTKTYLERYTLTAILGLAAQDADDDGKGGAADVSPLLQAARDAALQGWKPFAAWIASCTDAQKAELKPESDNLKRAAKAADRKGATQ
mgnify:CR=1 FL=1|jgi:hypothetical protein